MRALLATLVCLLAACPSNRESLSSGGGDDNGGAGNIPASCYADTDCALAASTCCECPSFAVSTFDPSSRACTGVPCPGTTCAANVRAACDQGTCVLACVEMACPTACPSGYQVDPTGCLSCECAQADLNGCTQDTDCVETRQDCCGCAQGGEDTAVLASERGAYDAALGCPTTPACQDVYVCTPGTRPTCVQGRCELLAAGGLPAGACGRADLPACPAGETCTVNTSDQANMQGVGVCVPQ